PTPRPAPRQKPRGGRWSGRTQRRPARVSDAIMAHIARDLFTTCDSVAVGVSSSRICSFGKHARQFLRKTGLGTFEYANIFDSPRKRTGLGLGDAARRRVPGSE